MPIFGLGLHMLVAIFFAVHAMRTRQNMYWLLILFSFPILGSIVYFFAIYMPGSRLERQAGKALVSAVKILDPTRELREARSAFEFTPTAQNQMRLASALLEAGEAQEAAQTYEACLNGPFANDLDIRLGALRACLAAGRPSQAIGHAQFIRQKDNQFRAEQVGILLAQAHSAAGDVAQARSEFDATLARFGSVQCYVEFAIWALNAGEIGLAERLQTEIDKTISRWSRDTRDMNSALLKRLKEAQNGARKLEANKAE